MRQWRDKLNSEYRGGAQGFVAVRDAVFRDRNGTQVRNADMPAVAYPKRHVDVETTFVFLSPSASPRPRVGRAAIPSLPFATPLPSRLHSTGTHEAAFALSRLLRHRDCPILGATGFARSFSRQPIRLCIHPILRNERNLIPRLSAPWEFNHTRRCASDHSTARR